MHFENRKKSTFWAPLWDFAHFIWNGMRTHRKYLGSRKNLFDLFLIQDNVLSIFPAITQASFDKYDQQTGNFFEKTLEKIETVKKKIVLTRNFFSKIK